MSGFAAFMPPIIPMMELPTMFIAFGLMGFELLQGLQQVSCGRRTLDVDHVLVNNNGLRIGVRKNRQGKIELLVDENELREKEGIELKEFTKQVQKRYAYAHLMERLKAEGYTLVEEKEEANESIRLVVRRWR
jgi:lauroyl/myristoyl acyltransferase